MYYRIFTTEESGLTDTTTFKSNGNIEQAKVEYLAIRKTQSIKGFKRPMPIEVTVEFN